MMFKKVILAAALWTAALSAGAGGLYVDVGTLGAGLGYQQPVASWATVRAGFDYAKFNYSTNKDQVHYSGDLKYATQYLVIDLYPFASSNFRLTTGLYHNSNKIDLKGNSRSAGTVTLNDVDYTFDQNSSLKASGKMDKNNVSPYVGIGWSSRADKADGFHFKGDIGALFQNPDVKLSASNIPDPNDTLAADMAAEQKKLQDDANKLKVYPVIQLGLSYNF